MQIAEVLVERYLWRTLRAGTGGLRVRRGGLFLFAPLPLPGWNKYKKYPSSPIQRRRLSVTRTTARIERVRHSARRALAPVHRSASAARFSEAVGCPCWLQLSWSKTNDLMPGSDLNAPEIGADGRKVASKLVRVLHSMLSHFLNNRISHFSTSNSSSRSRLGRAVK